MHDAPPGVNLPDAGGIRHPDLVVERDVGALAAHRVHARDLDAGRVHRHEEHREALVLGGLRVRAGQQEHVVGLVGHRREHLLATDDPIVAVTRRPGGHCGHVGPGVGLAVAETAHDLTVEDARQDVGLLVLVAADEQGGSDHGGDVQAVDRRP